MKRREILVAAAAAAVATRAGAVAHPMIERTSRPINEEALLGVFTERITPVESFFVRNHFDVSSVSNAAYSLVVDGLVAQPLTLSLADLQKMPQVTVEAVLQCAGNGRALFRPRVPGVQWQRGAVGNARWTGVRLKEILARAGVAVSAGPRFVQLQGHERPIFDQTPPFIRAIPFDKAVHDDTIVALTMNDAPLPLVHGAPARLIVPGWVGDDWMKWLAHVSVVNAEPSAFFYATAYRFPTEPIAPGAAAAPDQTAPMRELCVKSIIGAPLAGAVVSAGKPVAVCGVAFAGERPAVKVEISVDEGATWTAATLERAQQYGFALFKHDVTLVKRGPARILSRATDATGAVQPMAAQWNPGGYLYNAIDGVDVVVA